MTVDFCVEGKHGDCSECDRIDLQCHPFQVQLQKEKRKVRGAHSALERKELEILKERRHTVKQLGDHCYDLFCKWVKDDPKVTTHQLFDNLQVYKTKYNQMMISQERVDAHISKQQVMK